MPWCAHTTEIRTPFPLFSPTSMQCFWGCLYDKQMHVEALVRKHRFQLYVPDVWLVHRQHKKVAIAQIQTAEGEKSGLSDDVAALRKVSDECGKDVALHIL